MPLAVRPPGLTYERRDAAPPGSTVRDDVAGLVGLAERGPVGLPVRVESVRQFQSHFGAPVPGGFLADAVQAFVANGGQRAYVVRTASAQAASASLDVSREGGAPGWRVGASSPGAWGNALSVSLTEHAPVQAVAEAASTDAFAVVRGAERFARGSLVRLRRGAAVAYGVVAQTATRRVTWAAPVALSGAFTGPPLVLEAVEVRVRVFERGRLVATYDGLAPHPAHERYGPLVLRDASGDDGTLWPPPPRTAVPPLVYLTEQAPDPAPSAPLEATGRLLPLAGGADGLAGLAPLDLTGADLAPTDSAAVRARHWRGFRTLAGVDEVSVVALPDLFAVTRPPTRRRPGAAAAPCCGLATPAASESESVGDAFGGFSEADALRVQTGLAEWCSDRADRVALLDAPPSASLDVREGMQGAQVWRDAFDTDYAALYWPWVVVGGERPGEAPRAVPPSGHVAGLVALDTLRAGVHKAPANAPVRHAQAPTLVASAPEHALLNEVGVNVVLARPGRGIRVMGARTLARWDGHRFLNVRRLLIALRRDAERVTRWAVFEPNTAATREKVRLSLVGVLMRYWRTGALVGATEDEAFYVACDDDATPPPARDRGELVAEVGLAPSRPAEFVVVRVGRVRDAFHVTEMLTTPAGSALASAPAF